MDDNIFFTPAFFLLASLLVFTGYGGYGGYPHPSYDDRHGGGGYDRY
jgi:hypothetical protein